jgi:N-acetylmuramoyl-L-alanine amidase
MRRRSLGFTLASLGLGVFMACSADSSSNRRNSYGGIQNQQATWNQEYARTRTSTISSSSAATQSRGSQSPSSIYKQVNVKRDYLSYGARGRSRKSMKPQYVTIHSTQNWSQGADANRHSLALKRGALGRLSWHYTTDAYRAVQHLPTNEQGNHADYDGPGNRYSIGIEMCENPGNSRSATLERTAKLAAWLCVQYDLPVSRVVPHYKWPRHGKKPPNKNCPHFLLNNGRPGAKWANFVRVVDVYRRSMGGR